MGLATNNRLKPTNLPLWVGAFSVLFITLSGCGIAMKRPDLPYYFSHPLLNERWQDGGGANASAKKVAKAKRKRSKKRKARKGQVAKKAPPKAPLTQELRGNDLEVVRREMVLSAQRLVGIGDSFSQDSFLRHLLIVNNLGLGDFPTEGVVAWLYKHAGKSAGKVGAVAPGDLLFLGDKGPEQCVVVEKMGDDGRINFIGYVSGRVQRGVLSLNQRTARRDEKTQEVLNTFVGKSRLAGALLVGSYRLDRHKDALASQN